MKTLLFLSIAILAVAFTACGQKKSTPSTTKKYEVTKTDEEWKKQLTPQQYNVTREAGTERAFTGEYWDNHEKGMYMCVCCGNELFSSDTKFEQYRLAKLYAPLKTPASKAPDNSIGMSRTEVVCSRCGAHLGHVFDDGLDQRGFGCMNSAALKFCTD
ncbi:MAG: peptide-methionine (R)-S-oxide reductase MsrB [Bacteroidetes bacterium]|nr:peptide-methionine (R)-S-oxide reductase MsrB [Bacteroidota bacterium]